MDWPLAGALQGNEGVPLVVIVTVVLGADPGKHDDAAPQVMTLGM